ncbi:MAG: hypothetical protein ACNA8W_23370 [Bradymonadaceae bacterium]
MNNRSHPYALMIAFVMIWAGLSGCQTTGSPAEDACPGEFHEIDGASYCVHQRPITETGFECPLGLPHMHAIGDLLVCSADEELPEYVEEVLRERYPEETESWNPEEPAFPPSPELDGAYAISVNVFGGDPDQHVVLHWADQSAEEGAQSMIAGYNLIYRTFDTWDEAIAFRGSYVVLQDGQEIERMEVSFDACAFVEELGFSQQERPYVVFSRARGYAEAIGPSQTHYRPAVSCRLDGVIPDPFPASDRRALRYFLSPGPEPIEFFADGMSIAPQSIGKRTHREEDVLVYELVLDWPLQTDIENIRVELNAELGGEDIGSVEAAFRGCPPEWEGDEEEGKLLQQTRMLTYGPGQSGGLHLGMESGFSCLYSNGMGYSQSH